MERDRKESRYARGRRPLRWIRYAAAPCEGLQRNPPAKNGFPADAWRRTTEALQIARTYAGLVVLRRRRLLPGRHQGSGRRRRPKRTDRTHTGHTYGFSTRTLSGQLRCRPAATSRHRRRRWSRGGRQRRNAFVHFHASVRAVLVDAGRCARTLLVCTAHRCAHDPRQSRQRLRASVP
jgi:hypothetical protein